MADLALALAARREIGARDAQLRGVVGGAEALVGGEGSIGQRGAEGAQGGGLAAEEIGIARREREAGARGGERAAIVAGGREHAGEDDPRLRVLRRLLGRGKGGRDRL